MDQASWYTSDDLIKANNKNFKFLPPYSSELNPVEKLWWWLRKEKTHNKIFKTLNGMMDALESEFKNLTYQRYDLKRL